MERELNDHQYRNTYLYAQRQVYSPGIDLENSENIEPTYPQYKAFSPIQTDFGSPINTGVLRNLYSRAVHEQYD